MPTQPPKDADIDHRHRRAIDALAAAGGDISQIATRDMVTLIHTELRQIRSLQLQQTTTLAAVKEILEAWDDAKGFIRIVRLIGSAAKWLVVVGAAFTALWYALKTGIKG